MAGLHVGRSAISMTCPCQGFYLHIVSKSLPAASTPYQLRHPNTIFKLKHQKAHLLTFISYHQYPKVIPSTIHPNIFEPSPHLDSKNYFTSSDPHHDMLGGGCQVRVVIENMMGRMENLKTLISGFLGLVILVRWALVTMFLS